MNEEMEQFERLLKRQPMRQVPAEWRKEILSAIAEAQPVRSSPNTGRSFLSILASLFWPHPAAWGGLAAIWIFIFAVNFSLREGTPTMAEKTPPPSPEVIAQLQQQQRLFAELIGANDWPEADRPKVFAPKPRSENTQILTA